MADLTQIPAEHLPASAREIAERIGLAALQKLVNWCGGVSLYVPQEIQPDHPIVRAIGIGPARKLAEQYGLERLDIPNCKIAIQQAVNAAIVKDRESASENEVAMKYGCTGRWVRYLCANHRQDNGQADMFG